MKVHCPYLHCLLVLTHPDSGGTFLCRSTHPLFWLLHHLAWLLLHLPEQALSLTNPDSGGAITRTVVQLPILCLTLIATFNGLAFVFFFCLTKSSRQCRVIAFGVIYHFICHRFAGFQTSPYSGWTEMASLVTVDWDGVSDAFLWLTDHFFTLLSYARPDSGGAEWLLL